MKRTILLALLLWVVVLQVGSQAQVGVVAVTTTRFSDARVVKHSIAWTATAGGAVSANPQTFTMGSLIQIKFIPSAVTPPTALYDVTLVDANGLDYLGGTGANLSATASTQVRVAAPLFYDASGTLDLVVANAGVSTLGTVQLWIQQ